MDRSDSMENLCTVCHDVIHFYAVGPCDHPVCFKCSTRMRVLCKQMDCPICRSAMPQVVFVSEKKAFKDINLRDCIPNRPNKIFYEDGEIEDQYLDLLEFRCRQCAKREPFKTFAELQTHMRKTHQLFACDICLAHLKIFPYETKFYDRQNLATHRRIGDEDDKSYKGHPLCEFCDTRYLDKDELVKHLRKDHYYCHFCDQDGSNAFYNDYENLMVHFKESHFLCTEDECGNPSTRFTHAFASEIDLKSHKATVHNSKSRTIDLNFQYAPRPQARGNSGITGDDHRNRNRGDRQGYRRRQHEDSDLQRALEASVEEAARAKASPPVEERVPDPINDFPTLSGAPVTQIQSHAADAQRNGASASSKKQQAFPTLNETHGNGKKPQNPVSGSGKNYAAITHFVADPRPVVKEKKKESQPVSLGSVKGKGNNERRKANAPHLMEEDYPTLGGKNKANAKLINSSGAGSALSWLQKSSASEISECATAPSSNVTIVKAKPQSEESRPTKRSVTAMGPISDKEEFPSLGGKSVTRSEPASTNNSTWSKQKSGSNRKTAQVPKPVKVDDVSFELPDSYYRSYGKPDEQTPKPESKSAKKSKKSLPVNDDFPGLSSQSQPTAKVPSKGSSHNPAERKMKDAKPKTPNTNNNTGGKASKKGSVDTTSSNGVTQQNSKKAVDSSLNSIASGLADLTMAKSQQNDEKNGNSSNITKTQISAKSKVDWFDNPQEESKENNNNKLDNDNSFPSLHAMPTSVKCLNAPPGFSSSSTIHSKAPPGFSKPVIPPDLPKPTFSAYSYTPPANFASRNQMLVQSVKFCLETVKDGFDSFKSLSFQFRQGVIDASAYYINCQHLIGEMDFTNIFPELLALLPDINKQQELWFQHQVVLAQKREPESKKSMTRDMSPCGKCHQIVLKDDLQHHNMQHGDGQDFPSLRNTPFSGGNQPSGAWIKAT